MKALISCVVLAIINLVVAYQYSCFYGDIVDETVGYFASLFVIPPLFGMFTGCLAVAIIGPTFLLGIRRYWWILLVSALFAALPSLYYVVGLTFFGEGA